MKLTKFAFLGKFPRKSSIHQFRCIYDRHKSKCTPFSMTVYDIHVAGTGYFRYFEFIRAYFSGSPAEKADLEVADEILEVNGESLENSNHTDVIAHIHNVRRYIQLFCPVNRVCH